MFFEVKARQCNFNGKIAPSGVDEMSGIVMTNKEGQMTVISLSLHTKQPKRCVICGDKGYIEIMEYPRACKATIVCTEQVSEKKSVRVKPKSVAV